MNADDLGWSRSVDLGIAEAHAKGIVTSASLLANGRAFDDAVGLAASTPSLDVGVHLNIYRGEPLSAPDRVRSLTIEGGVFPGSVSRIVTRLLLRAIDPAEVEAEFRAQIDKVRAAGIVPSHLDSEKHLHLWPSLFRIVCELAHDYSIPYVRLVREPPAADPLVISLAALSAMDAPVARAHGLRTPDGTIGVAEAPTDLATLARLLRRARGRDVEFVVHPGHIDEEFWILQGMVPNKLDHSREQQSRVLAMPAARRLAEEHACTLQRRAGEPESAGPVV